MTKKVNIWDTYVPKKEGGVIHFDIVAPAAITDPEQIYEFGRQYLITKDQEGQPVTAKECRLCHLETLRPEWETAISDNGFFIIEMEGCQ